MADNITYTLEYWIKSTQFSKEELENHVTQALDKFLEDIDLEIEDHRDNYLVLHISATERYIDACYEKLELDRDWALRTRDELGDKLRTSAFPVLAEIELRLRNFINQVLVDMLGFDWWNSYISEKFREKVKEIETKAGKHQVKLHHPIEFTLFENLIKIVTHRFQSWPDERVITASDLFELLDTCSSIEDMRREIDKRKKVISLWDDVFSNYFTDKEAWSNLKKKIEGYVIPTRNKVMHHRLMRIHELEQVEKIRDDINQVISLAKSELSEAESSEASQNIRIALESSQGSFIDILAAAQSSFIDPSLFAAAQAGIDSSLLAAAQAGIDPNILAAAQDYHLDPNILAAAQDYPIDPNILAAAQDYPIDPNILAAAQSSFIDPSLLAAAQAATNSSLPENFSSDEEKKDEMDDSDEDEIDTDNN